MEKAQCLYSKTSEGYVDLDLKNGGCSFSFSNMDVQAEFANSTCLSVYCCSKSMILELYLLCINEFHIVFIQTHFPNSE